VKGKVMDIHNQKLENLSKSLRKAYVRVKVDSSIRRNYLRFRKELGEKFKLSKSGIFGYTELSSKGLDVNIFRGEKYWIFIVYGKAKVIDEFFDIFNKYFEGV
jgi:hypothetical protein